MVRGRGRGGKDNFRRREIDKEEESEGRRERGGGANNCEAKFTQHNPIIK